MADYDTNSDARDRGGYDRDDVNRDDVNRDDVNRDDVNRDDDRFRPDETPRVAALSDLHDFQVAEDYPDPRGWQVLTADGAEVGKVHDLIVDTGSMRTRYLDVRLDHDKINASGRNDDWDVLVPVGSAQLAENDDQVLLPSMSAAQLASLPVFEHGEITRDYENSVLGGVGGMAAGGAAAGAAAAGAANRDFYDTQHFDDRNFFGRGNLAGMERADARNTNETRQNDTDAARGIPVAEETLDVGERQVQAGEADVHRTVDTDLRKEHVDVDPNTDRNAGEARNP